MCHPHARMRRASGIGILLLVLGACSDAPVAPRSVAGRTERTRRAQHPVLREPVRRGPDDPVRNPEQPATFVRGDKPLHSAQAARARVQGVVLVDALIERDGTVSEVQVLKPLPFGLDQAAASAVRTWKFRPAEDRGRVVRSVQRIEVSFDPRPLSEPRLWPVRQRSRADAKRARPESRPCRVSKRSGVTGDDRPFRRRPRRRFRPEPRRCR
jgi:protein TonB